MADETNDFASKRPSTWTHQARSDVELKPAWRLDDPTINRDTVAFWRDNNLLPKGATGEQRLKELVAVGYDGDKICAVATAFIVHVDFVNCKLAMFRNAVSPQKRRSRIGTVITTYSRELLEKWSLEHPEEAVMGMGTVTQARELEGLRRAYMRSTHLGFVGWTREGHPIRIAWFEHARVSDMPGKTPRTDMFSDSG
jgi:hypothetical protein